jgi:transcriptional regulator with XRE-family HTH domain
MGGVAVLAIFDIGKKLLEKLRRPAYRHAYLAEHVRRGIAYQIRALRDQRGWKQGKFSAELGKPQSVVCRLEDPSYGKVTIQTLLEVANVFDVALEIRFVPYSSFIQRTRDVSATSMHVPEFKDDFKATPTKIVHATIPYRATSFIGVADPVAADFSTQINGMVFVDNIDPQAINDYVVSNNGRYRELLDLNTIGRPSMAASVLSSVPAVGGLPNVGFS